MIHIVFGDSKAQSYIFVSKFCISLYFIRFIKLLFCSDPHVRILVCAANSFVLSLSQLHFV